jgi:hypothetical protein
VNNEAPELSAETRRIINAARGSDDPTREDHDRVKTRWLAGVAALAGVSSLAEAARAAGGIGWGLKAAGVALAGAIGIYLALPGAGGVGSGNVPPAGEPGGSAPTARRGDETPAWRGTTYERHQKTAPGASAPPQALAEPNTVTSPSAGGTFLPDPSITDPPVLPAPVVAPVVVELPAPSGAAPDVLPSEEVAGETAVVEKQPASRPAAAAARRKSRAGRVAAARAPASEPEAVAAAAPSGQLGAELELLSQVRSSVQEGTPARALELLSQYETRFGRPILGMEADALRVDALCRSGQREAAQESARAFQNEWPGSPLGPRVSSSCP